MNRRVYDEYLPSAFTLIASLLQEHCVINIGTALLLIYDTTHIYMLFCEYIYAHRIVRCCLTCMQAYSHANKHAIEQSTQTHTNTRRHTEHINTFPDIESL